MKKQTQTNRFLFIFAILACWAWTKASAQLITDDFSSAAGTLLTAASPAWVSHNGAGTNNITITAPGSPAVTYSGYLSSGTGNEVTMAVSGQDVNRTFSSQSTGSVYVSLLVNVTSATTTGDYFYHLCQVGGGSASTFEGRVFVKKDASNNILFGVSKNSTTTISYASGLYSTGVTYLLVLKYTFNTGATNDDVCYLYINPTLNAIEPPTANATSTDAATDLTSAVAIALRQGGSSSGAALKIDGLRVATTWADIVGAVASGVADPTSVTATPASTTQINLGWALNANSNNVMVVYNTTNTFGVPANGTAYSAGNTISGGGTVAYVGGATSYNHTGLSASTLYYYKVYSVDGSNNYSTGVSVSASTLDPEPSNHVTAFAATTVSPTFSAIDVTWTDATGTTIPDGYVVKASAVDYASIAVPVDHTPETPGTLVKIVAAGVQVAHFTGLTGSTAYYFEIFPYTNSGTDIDYKTDTPPQATATTTATPALAKVFISEYIEGTSNNKAIEIYNGEPTAIDLTKLTLKLYTNGGITPTSTYTGTGTLAANQSLVIYNAGANAEIAAGGNVANGVIGYNGDDALELVYDSQTTDVFGTIGTDPGTSWSVAGDASGAVDKTLLRKLTVTQGNTTPSGSFGTDAATSEWVIMATDYAKNLGEFGTAWNGTTDTDWPTAGNWDMGVPTSTINAIIPDVTNDPILTASAQCNNLLIKSFDTPVLTIASNGALTVNGTLSNKKDATALVVKSTASGTGSLIHNTDAVPATIERYVTGSATLTDMMYHFVSIPLTTGGTSNQFLGAYLYEFDVAGNTWTALGASTTTALDNLKGYMIYYPEANTTYSFVGNMNNGSFAPIALSTGSGFNLVPNPYPSAIDWNAASGWVKTGIGASIYFWPAGKPSSSSNYATWNGASGTNGGTQYIPVGQSFFVQATGTPDFKMNNGVRVHNTQGFWKNANTVDNLLRIKSVASSNNASDETVVHFRQGATTAFDFDMDAQKLQGGAEAPQLSTVSSDQVKLAINSMPFMTSEAVVPVNFTLNTNSNVTFTASQLESFAPGITITLEDKKLGQLIDLRANPTYTFAYQTTDPENRFNLRLMGVTALPENGKAEGTAYVAGSNILVEVPAMDNTKANLALVDALGKTIVAKQIQVNGQMQIKTPSVPGIYFLNLNNGSTSFVAKVVVQ